MCSNKIEFLALNEKAAWKFKFVELMHIWEDLGEYLVEIFLGEYLSFHHKIRIWHIAEEENDVHLSLFDFYTWHWSSIQQIRNSLWDCHLMPLV